MRAPAGDPGDPHGFEEGEGFTEVGNWLCISSFIVHKPVTLST